MRQARGGDMEEGREGRGHHDPETPAPGLRADTDTGLIRHGTLPGQCCKCLQCCRLASVKVSPVPLQDFITPLMRGVLKGNGKKKYIMEGKSEMTYNYNLPFLIRNCHTKNPNKTRLGVIVTSKLL